MPNYCWFSDLALYKFIHVQCRSRVQKQSPGEDLQSKYSATLFKKKLRHRYFPVNFEKSLRISTCRLPLGDCNISDSVIILLARIFFSKAKRHSHICEITRTERMSSTIQASCPHKKCCLVSPAFALSHPP